MKFRLRQLLRLNKIVTLLLVIPGLYACNQDAKVPACTIEFISDELANIIDSDAEVEVIADGFQFTEGPVWLKEQNMLLFSDIPANTVYKWTEAKGAEVYLQPSGYTDSIKRGGFLGSNGLHITSDGKLLLCQHGDRRIAIMNASVDAPRPIFTTLAGMYNGKRLNSPNDFFPGKNGKLYFTDPSYGFENGSNDPKKEIPFTGVYVLDETGNVKLLIDSLQQPNGIGITPDGNTLLVSSSGPKTMWYAFDLTPGDSLSNPRVFYDASTESAAGACDGFKIDSNGNIFASGPGGLWIFTQNGNLIGKIKVDGVSVTNCALSPDEKTIYLTAEQYLLRVNLRQ